jgi:hypothetical protein
VLHAVQALFTASGEMHFCFFSPTRRRFLSLYVYIISATCLHCDTRQHSAPSHSLSTRCVLPKKNKDTRNDQPVHVYVYTAVRTSRMGVSNPVEPLRQASHADIPFFSFPFSSAKKKKNGSTHTFLWDYYDLDITIITNHDPMDVVTDGLVAGSSRLLQLNSQQPGGSCRRGSPPAA